MIQLLLFAIGVLLCCVVALIVLSCRQRKDMDFQLITQGLEEKAKMLEDFARSSPGAASTAGALSTEARESLVQLCAALQQERISLQSEPIYGLTLFQLSAALEMNERALRVAENLLSSLKTPDSLVIPMERL